MIKKYIDDKNGRLQILAGEHENQKLMFINNLFDGSSESFSNAVKLLDNKEVRQNMLN